MKKNNKVVYWYAGEWKNNNKHGYGEQFHFKNNNYNYICGSLSMSKCGKYKDTLYKMMNSISELFDYFNHSAYARKKLEKYKIGKIDFTD